MAADYADEYLKRADDILGVAVEAKGQKIRDFLLKCAADYLRLAAQSGADPDSRRH